jgi:hypothetical protein
MTWNPPIWRPNAVRSCAYWSVCSKLRCAPATQPAAPIKPLALELPHDV